MLAIERFFGLQRVRQANRGQPDPDMNDLRGSVDTRGGLVVRNW